MFVLIQSEAEAVEVLNCEYRYRDEWCHIRNADLTKNTINEKFTFQYLPNLVEIELHDNKIRSVAVTMFQNNPKLETFQNLKQLKLVNVDGNECVDNRIGCEVMGCYEKINRTKLDSALLSCFVTTLL
jgi:hypothetical protein